MTKKLLALPEFLTSIGASGYEWDMRADTMEWFGDWQSLFGAEAVPPANSQQFFETIFADDRTVVFGNDSFKLDRQYRVKRSDGTLVWVVERGQIEHDNGYPRLQRSILRVTERMNDRTSYQDQHAGDPLTGTLDRRQMLTQITKAMDSGKTARRDTAYLVVGIDKMSFVNEAVGMEAGDAVLRGVAERLKLVIPSRATLARVGGDMFGVLMPAPLSNEIKRTAEQILQVFRDQPVITRVTPLHITVSIGGIRLLANARNATEAMINAEQALHEARHRGRNLFVEYEDSPLRVQQHRQTLELGERIKHAFKNDGFRLAYQPMISTRTGLPACYEALVRMFDSDGKPIPAAHFVPAIEQLGLALELDKLVLDLAIKDLEKAPEMNLAVNVSGLTAVQASWPDYVQIVLGTRPDIAERVVFEITETAAIVDVSETKRFVSLVRKLGGQVSLDDFGAGFTSIRHLRTLQLSVMKIDKDLLHDLLINAEQQHLVLVLIELAHGLNLQVVAEGVETADIADWLRRAKVDLLQGYYFGKPSLDKPWLDASKATTPVILTSQAFPFAAAVHTGA
jgi:diguanylate cyclase (GGDEF)-like protein